MNRRHPPSNLANKHCTDPEAFLRLLHEPGDVFEIRSIDCPERLGGTFTSTAAGWFNDSAKAAQAVAKVEQVEPPAVYVTVNPCEPALLGRCANRVQPKAKATTKDADIVRRRWLFVDIDAKRPAGVSATDAELAEAQALADGIRRTLVAEGWPEPLLGASGNGAYLFWRVDLPNDDRSADLVKGVLQAMAGRFDTDGAEVDCSTFNASRICKLLGTVARKGDALVGVDGVEDRPHRRSWFVTPDGPLSVVASEQLETLAAQVAEPESPKATDGRPASGDAFGRCCKYLAKMDPAVSGELGSRKLYRAACVALHDFGLSDDEAAQAIEQAYNPRCVPPWEAAGVRRAIGKARREGGPSKGFGSASVDPDRPPPAAPGPDDPWDDPETLPDALSSVLPYQPDLLPPEVGDVVNDVAERMQCPADFPAASMLVALAAVIGCRLGIRPKRYDNWLVVPNLWGCVVGRPSLKKSPAIAHAEKRIRAIEARERERLADEVEAFRLDAVIAEASAKAVKSAIGKAAKSGDVVEARRLASELQETREAVEPAPRRIITSDATIEKLGDMLNRHTAGLLLWVDELTGWMRGLDRPDMAGVRQQFLTLWNGLGRLNIDRIGRGETVVESPCLSLFGCCTPGGLSEYVTSALRGGRGDDGLIQRIQVLVWPDSPREYHPVDRRPDSEARDRLAAAFESLADLDVESFAERDRFDDGSGIPWVQFDADGQSVFDAWDAQFHPRIRSGDLSEAFESHLSKFASLVPSIALVLHLAMGGRGPVSGRAAELAVGWAEYLESHAARLYSVAASPERRLAKPLLSRLTKWPEGKPIRVRDVVRHGWSGLDDTETVERVLSLLAEAGWVRAAPVRPPSGRPTTDWLLHPRAIDFLKRAQNRTDKTDETPAKAPGGGSFVSFVGSDSEGSEENAPGDGPAAAPDPRPVDPPWEVAGVGPAETGRVKGVL